MKNKVDRLDIGKLEITPLDLSKLTNAVKNVVIKKTEYNAKIKIYWRQITWYYKLNH